MAPNVAERLDREFSLHRELPLVADSAPLDVVITAVQQVLDEGLLPRPNTTLQRATDG